MTRYARTIFLSDTARSILGCGLILVLFLASSVFAPRANAIQTRSTNTSRSAVGRLKVWVPAGMVGGDYWIYLNGRIVSAPPHGTTDPKSHSFMTINTGGSGSDGSRESNGGWEIWTAEGRVLKMRHENYDDSLTRYIGSTSGDALHVFQASDLPLHPGKFTVEVVMLSRGGPSGSPYSMRPLPFVITQKYTADVRPGQTTQLYTGVPDDWSETILVQALVAQRVCPKGASPPDTDQLQRWVKEYLDDPMVNILRGVDASSLSRSKGVVVLNLPASQGGPREFDGNQIGYIVGSISARNNVPSHREVADCQNRFPQFSQSYAAYDKMVSTIDEDIESFHKLAATLSADVGH
jgi:hypothetical protein